MKQHILLIDDDKDELSIFTDALKMIPGHERFKCTYASGALQALEMNRYLKPDFIFVDRDMPVHDGFYFLKNARNNHNLWRTKIFLYSTRITDHVHKHAILLGANDCILKPTSISELAAILEAIFIPREAPFALLKDIDTFYKDR